MPTFASLLVLAIIAVVVSHPIQRRQSSAGESCRQTVTSVCRILWHIEDTIEHCPARSVCNSTALRRILAAIKADFASWVRFAWRCEARCMHFIYCTLSYCRFTHQTSASNTSRSTCQVTSPSHWNRSVILRIVNCLGKCYLMCN